MAVQEGTLHEAQAACSTATRGAAEPVGMCRSVFVEAAGAQPPPRGPAALQRYNGLSLAEAEALEHVHTAEGASQHAGEPLPVNTYLAWQHEQRPA